MTHDHYGHLTLHTNGKITHTLSSNRLYYDPADPIVFVPVVVKLRVPYTITFCSCFSLMSIERVVFWSENDPRNLINLFPSFYLFG